MKAILKKNIVLVLILLLIGVGATFETKDVVSIIIPLIAISTLLTYRYINIKKDA